MPKLSKMTLAGSARPFVVQLALLTIWCCAESANDALRAAADGPMKGLLGVTDEELVSMDFKGDERSSIVDGPSTMVTGDKLLKVIAWYDNEWGYSCRVADLAAFMAERLQ